MEIIAKFEGGAADNHRLPAYEAAQSLVGISRTFVLTSHFIVTGEVRKRTPYDERLGVFLRPLEEGSVEAVFDFVPLVAGLVPFALDLGQAITNSIIYDTLKYVWRRGTGGDVDIDTRELANFDERNPGHLDALVEAVEPALKSAHESVGNGATIINIINGDNNVVQLNARSKEYTRNTQLLEHFENMDVSVASLNVNTRAGRVFFFDLGRTVFFQVDKAAPPATLGTLSLGLNSYAENRQRFGNNRIPENIITTTNITFRRAVAPDGRTKSIRIYGAQRVIPEQ
jgi:hypothetical protein